jgi:hypothetical protein
LGEYFAIEFKQMILNEHFLLLLGLFWLGFSPSFYFMFVMFVAFETKKRLADASVTQLSLLRRLIMTAPGFMGLAGICYLLGCLREHLTNETMSAFVLSVPVGVFVALFMKKRL